MNEFSTNRQQKVENVLLVRKFVYLNEKLGIMSEKQPYFANDFHACSKKR